MGQLENKNGGIEASISPIFGMYLVAASCSGRRIRDLCFCESRIESDRGVTERNGTAKLSLDQRNVIVLEPPKL